MISAMPAWIAIGSEDTGNIRRDSTAATRGVKRYFQRFGEICLLREPGIATSLR